jgi:4-hydroxybutyrate CoA-transferase
MSWQEIYKSKLAASMEDAVKYFASGDRIFYSLGASAPVDLINGLTKKLPELGDITFITGILTYPFEYLHNPEYKDFFTHRSIWAFVGDRRCANKESVYFYSRHLSKTDSMIENELKPNVLIFESSPPDENGNLNFGPYGIFLNDFISQRVDKIIVQVNNNAPYILGEKNLIHVSKVDCIIEQDHHLVELPPIVVTDVEKQIARFIVDRIDDGATIQIGVGGLANAICSFLDGKKDLGVHSEFFVDSMMPLAKKGVINGAKKNINPGEISVSFGGLSKEVYAFMDNNPAVKMYPVTYINNPNVIAQIDNMVSVNNALAVDLTGQVAAEGIGFTQYSGVGGQIDFVRGATMAKNGQSFIALQSYRETKDGIASRIALTFEPGTIVTTPRSDVDMIVTEYGIAELRYKSLRERAKGMIAIAHPQFRDELAMQAQKAGLL